MFIHFLNNLENFWKENKICKNLNKISWILGELMDKWRENFTTVTSWTVCAVKKNSFWWYYWIVDENLCKGKKSEML
jgi:hypothetical protein